MSDKPARNEDSKPLADCERRYTRIEHALFGNGDAEHSILFRLLNVERYQKTQTKILGAIGVGVLGLILHAAAAMLGLSR